MSKGERQKDVQGKWSERLWGSKRERDPGKRKRSWFDSDDFPVLGLARSSCACLIELVWVGFCYCQPKSWQRSEGKNWVTSGKTNGRTKAKGLPITLTVPATYQRVTGHRASVLEGTKSTELKNIVLTPIPKCFPSSLTGLRQPQSTKIFF